MQQVVSKSTSNVSMNNQGNRHSYAVLIMSLILFAVSGIVTGFATAAFTGSSKQAQQPQSQNSTTKILAKNTPQVMATQVKVMEPQQLGCPVIDSINSPEKADDSLSSTLTAHAVDASAMDKGKCKTDKDGKLINGNPMRSAGITCKLWLSTIPADGQTISPSKDITSHVEMLNKPFKYEVEHGLIFDSTTAQVQPCDAQGQGSWKFGISSSVKPGDYYLAVLTNWDGKFSTCSWIIFKVIK